MKASWRPDRILFGGDVNPDQWTDEILADDIDLMRRAGVNSATVGVFSWSALQPEPDRFAFGWLDRAMDRFADAGIGVILATPTASPPPWFSIAHPEALPFTADGVQLHHGSRDTYNPASDAYREAARVVTRELATRYAAHPALRMWHLHNEYGTVSYGPDTDAAFRRWLEARYGTVDELNRAWHTSFWSQGYRSWREVSAPQRTQYLANPTQMLDFRRFSADILLDCLRDQLQIVRDATPAIPATTNYILATWLHFDHWAFARELDVVSIDDYPDPAAGDIDAQVAFAADLARSLAGRRPWLLMEQSASPLFTGAGRMLVREPGALRRHTLRYVARGASGTLFFQWRAGPAGSEFFHSAMVPHAGADTRVFREISALGAELAELAAVVEPPQGAVVEARVAIAWSADSWWASESPGLPVQVDYHALVRDIHAATWRAGVTVDFVPLDADFAGYDLVIVPTALVLTAAHAEGFASYAYGGGRLALWYLTGTTDENLHVRRGGYSGAIAALAGIRVEEHVPVAAEHPIPLEGAIVGVDWAEVVHTVGAEVLVAHEGGAHELLAAGAPAVTVATTDAGRVYYVSVHTRGEDLRSLLALVLADAGVTASAPEGVELVRRRAGSATFLFAFNRTDRDTAIRASGVDVRSGRRLGPDVVMPAGSLVVLREDDADQVGAR